MMAAEDFGDWIRIGVLILVIGGSALGSIAQALIKKFKAKKEDQSQGSDLPRAKPAVPDAGARKPMYPVARPMPQRPGSATSTRPAAPVQPTITQRRMPSPQVRTQQAQRTPPPAPAPLRESVEVQVPTSQLRQAKAESERARSRRKKAARKKQAKAEDATPLSEHHLEVSERVRHPATETVGLESEQQSHDSLKHPTRKSLRRAILMKELLGPPVALRRDDESI